jgi:hypothetical protein
VFERISGAKAMLYCSDHDKINWLAVREDQVREDDASPLMLESRLNNIWRSIAHTNLSEVKLTVEAIDAYTDCQIVVLDLCSLMEQLPDKQELIRFNLEAIADALCKKRGAMIIIGSDPLLDLEYSGSMFTMLHTLVSGYEIYDSADEEINKDFSIVGISRVAFNLRRVRADREILIKRSNTCKDNSR